MQEWIQRAKDRMRELGINQNILATRMGVTRGTIGHYLHGRREAPVRRIQEIANHLHVDPAWLLYGKTREDVAHQKPYAPWVYWVPLIGWASAGNWREAIENLPDDVILIPVTKKIGPQCFALEVKGDSMTSYGMSRMSFPEGARIILDPDKALDSGCYIVACDPMSHEATFKQYILDGGKAYLKPLNHQYPTVEIQKDIVACGVVVQMVMDI